MYRDGHNAEVFFSPSRNAPSCIDSEVPLFCFFRYSILEANYYAASNIVQCFVGFRDVNSSVSIRLHVRSNRNFVCDTFGLVAVTELLLTFVVTAINTSSCADILCCFFYICVIYVLKISLCLYQINSHGNLISIFLLTFRESGSEKVFVCFGNYRL